MLRRMVEADRLTSILLWGPAGCGKTTLAAIIAEKTSSAFETLNAVLAGVKELREVIEKAKERRALHATRTILFVDEIHRWNKAQQDALLQYVEEGTVTLIGATTENPAFEVIRPLISRSRIFELNPLTQADLQAIVQRALADPVRGYGGQAITIDDEALAHITRIAAGDARNALNALELAVLTTPPGPDGAITIDLAVAQESIQKRAVAYDKGGDQHYDTISAFIKSIRGSDPDAALFWLGKMVSAGEDPRFIMRRLLILAGEDIGLANHNGIVVVSACAQAFEWVGLPEGLYHLALAALYLAASPKSNSTTGIFAAIRAIEAGASTEVPLHLRTSPRKREEDHPSYKYPHDYPDHWVRQQYLPDRVEGGWFRPSDQGYEARIKEWMEKLRGEQT